MSRVKVLADVHARIEFTFGWGWGRMDAEQRAREMERTAREFEVFVRDHRSQDPVSIEIVREYQDQCSHCGYSWDVDENGIPVCCDSAVSEAESGQAAA